MAWSPAERARLTRSCVARVAIKTNRADGAAGPWQSSGDNGAAHNFAGSASAPCPTSCRARMHARYPAEGATRVYAGARCAVGRAWRSDSSNTFNSDKAPLTPTSRAAPERSASKIAPTRSRFIRLSVKSGRFVRSGLQVVGPEEAMPGSAIGPDGCGRQGSTR